MKKYNLRRRIAVTSRGMGLLKRYCPGLLQGRALYETINSLQPFVSVWFSARIINEIAAERRIETVVIYTAAIILINFTCAAVKSVIKRVCDEKESQMWSWFGKIFADKQMSLDFPDLENAGVQRQRQGAEENLFMFGNGLGQLVWSTSMIVRAFVNIIASVAMTVSLFASHSDISALNSPLWIFAILACIALGGLCNSRATVKENDVFMRWCKDNVWFNRMFMFCGRDLYMDQEKAKDVRIYRQNIIAEKVLGKLIDNGGKNQRDIFRMSLYPALASLVIGLANAACYLFVAVKALTGAFGAGSVVQYVAVLSKLGDGFQELMYILSDNEVYCTYLEQLFKWLDIPEKMYSGSLAVDSSRGSQDLHNSHRHIVEFCDVSFKYPGMETYALRHVSLKLNAGEKLAVVGMNGSGKTTFIKLMCRLYDPTEGCILFDGTDIRSLNYDGFMSVFSVVFQDFRLFSFDIAQNVAAGLDYDGERVKRCLEKAGFGERLASMSGGIQTRLYKNFDADGVEISGGEAQKLALARALYKQAPVIVLDEPTAALDPVSEFEVYSRFNEIAGDRTAVYISHRLASCRFCDRIAVFNGGEVIQTGTHEKLLADGGRYSELWNAQAQYYMSR